MPSRINPKLQQNNLNERRLGLTIEQILQQQKETEFLDRVFASLHEEPIELNISELVEEVVPLLGCNHLSYNDLKNYYDKYKDYLDDVFTGRAQNDRHDSYYESNCRGGLWYNTSTCTFNSKQTDFIISLFRATYDKGNIYKYCNYYFQVLCPEFCLIVFMEEHKMGRKEALEYLDKRPVDY